MTMEGDVQTQPRAFRLLRGDTVLGYLGEGPGPFLSASRQGGRVPQLRHVRFTSKDYGEESELSEILTDHPDFDGVVAQLKTAGYRLEPMVYNEIFAAPEDAPRFNTREQEEAANDALDQAMDDIE